MDAIPNRVSNRSKIPVVKHSEPPAWEREKIGHRNRDGTFVPIINEKGVPLRRKEYSERKREIDNKLRRKRQTAVVDS